MQESVVYQRILREGVQIGKQEGRQEGEASILIRQLTRRFGSIEPKAEEQIRNLPITRLEVLGDVLLDFSNPADLGAWLKQERPEN